MEKGMAKKIAIAAVVVVLAGVGVYKMNILGTTQVKVARIEVGDLLDMNLYTGMVVPGEVKPVYISAPAVIERILVKNGEEVTKDTELILFSNKSIMENDKALRVNELDIQNVKLQIADLDSGSMKLELDNRELEIKNLEEKIKADMRKLPVITEEARTLQKRAEAYMQLLAKDGVSATEASRVNTESGRKQVELEDLKTDLELNRQKHQLMVVSYESLKRELNIEEAKLRSNLEKLELENETLKIREKQLKQPLKAGVDGVVVGVDVQEGSVTQPGERLLAVSTNGGNRVNVEVPLYQSSTITKGQPAVIVSRDSDGDKRYKGKVEKVSTAAVDSKYSKTKEKVIQVEVSIDEENDLRPGFIADVEISGQAKTSVPVVNSFSVLEEDGEYFVYINDEGRARKQKVSVGARTVNSYEILDLPLGTQVVVNPFKVRNGERIRVVE